uniref:Uncharacterized protein n=1 Tax=Anguilla anguilla TaxID=7936 RepID=A0A0E9WLB0_ANGAN
MPLFGPSPMTHLPHPTTHHHTRSTSKVMTDNFSLPAYCFFLFLFLFFLFSSSERVALVT